MKSSPKTLSFLMVTAVSFALLACQEPYHQKEEQYYFIAANINLPYWQEGQAGMLDAAKELGVKGELDGPTAMTPQEEVDSFMKAVALKPAGIMVSVSRPDLFKGPIDAAIGQGIPVIAVDSDAPESKRVMFVGTDNFRAGQESGRRMASILKGQGSVVVVTIPGQLNLDERLHGVTDALQKSPGIKVIQTIDDKGDSRQAYDGISAILSKKTKVDGVICLEASGGAGVADALHRVDMEGKIAIASFDNDPETLDWIQRGAINATVAQKPYLMGYYGLKFLDDLHHNAVHAFKDWKTAPTAPLPAWVDTGTMVLDKSNLATYRDALAPHPKPL